MHWRALSTEIASCIAELDKSEIGLEHLSDAEEQHDLLSRTSVNTGRLSNFISGLLAFSRIEGVVAFQRVDLGGLLDEVCETLQLRIQERHARVVRGEMPKLMAASVHMTQLFQNLIANALKFSDKEAPEIRISAREMGVGWEFVVEDNGPGIDDAYTDDVFKLFKRLERTDGVEGSGLGLSICHKIVEQYGGSISVARSEALGGAAFLFTLYDRETS